ncbi:MAG: hypothetical protein HY075_15605 [Deltaproteobacteria bacterium]|nr:hypothetical protein [Deltaproteobacteria bacterium]
MKTILSVVAVGLLFAGVASAADDYNLVCKSTYDVVDGEENLTVKGPTLVAPFIKNPIDGDSAQGSKEKTKRGPGYTASYNGRSGKAVISVTTASGIVASAVGIVSTEIESQLKLVLDKDTSMTVACTIQKNKAQ